MIDPSIALQVRPPQVQADSPFESAGKMLQLRNLVQGGQMQELQLQQQQRQIQDDQTAQQILAEHKGDLGTALPAMAGKLSMPSFLNYRAKWIDGETKKLDMAEKKGKISDQAHETIGKLGLGVKATGNTPEAFMAAVDSAVALNPDLGQILKPYVERAQKDPATIGPMMDSLIAGTAVGQKERSTVADETRATAATTQATTAKTRLEKESPGIEATAAEKVRMNAAAQLGAAKTPEEYSTILESLPYGVAKVFEGKTPEQARQLGMTPAQQTTADQTSKRDANTARHETVMEGQGAQRINIERGNSARLQKQFDATFGSLNGPDGKPLEPEAARSVAMQDPLAVQIAEYRGQPPNVGTRGGPGAGIMRKVLAINPQYDAKNWKQQGDTLKDFNTGKSAQELGATSVALGHLGVMKDAIAALENGNIRVLNQLANRLGLETGTSSAALFRTIVHRVGPELTKAYIAGGGGQGERGMTEADFDPSLGPKILKDNIAVSATLLDGKVQQKQQQWKNVMGDRPMPGLSPQAVEVRKQLTNGTKPAVSAHSVGQVVTMKNGAKVKITVIHDDGTFDGDEVKP